MFEETIKKIVKKRESERSSVKTQRDRLRKIRTVLGELALIKANSFDVYTPVFEMNGWLRSALEEFDLDQSLKLYDDALEQCENLLKRFSRETVNIAVIGEERNGKSSFLQAVSGLDDRCIPALSKERCTGVTSTIKNSDEDGVQAKICFKSIADMVEEINLYLSLQGGSRIERLEQLSTIQRTELYGAGLERRRRGAGGHYQGQEIPSKACVYLETFYEDYIRSYDKWKNLVQEKPLTETYTDEDEIAQFVARYGPNDEPYKKFVAVKAVTISKRFRQNGIGGTQLIDTVGIGDLSLNTEQKMLEAIRDRSDAVIYIFMPDNSPGTVGLQIQQCDLIGKLEENFGSKRMNQWMACLINQRAGEPDQRKNCHAFKRDIEEKYMINPPFMRVDIVDVTNVDEVDRFVLTFLNEVAARLKTIDSVFVEDVNTAVKLADDSLLKVQENFGADFIHSMRNSVDSKFFSVFEEMRERLETFHSEATHTYDDIKNGQLKQVFEYGESGEIEKLLQDYKGPGDQEPVSRTLFHVWRNVRQIADSTGKIVRKEERDFKHGLAEIMNEYFPLGIDTEDTHYFSKMADLLFKKEPLFKDLRETFLYMDTFSLDAITGVLKLLFSYHASQRFDGGRIKVLSSGESDYGAVSESPADREQMRERVMRRIQEFLDDISRDAYFQTNCSVSIQQQIDAEYGFFFSAFHSIYESRWKMVFDRLFEEGKIWTTDIDEFKHQEELARKVRTVLSDSVLSVRESDSYIYF